MLRSMWKNKGTLLLAFTLALTVWVYAINEDDPVQEDIFPAAIPIQYTNLAEGLILSGNPPQECTITIKAPRSVWDSLTADDIEIVVNLSGRDTGQYRVSLAEPQLDIQPAMVTNLNPEEINIEIETLVERSLPIEVQMTGEPAIGYEADDPSAEPDTATISGPASMINLVSTITASVNITGQRQSTSQTVQLIPQDENGYALLEISTQPEYAVISTNIEQGERYRLVAVIPIINGEPDFGFRITKIDVIPEQVIIYSSDPSVFDSLPGYVETVPIDIAGSQEPVEMRASLDLPEGTALVGDQNILVQVSIEAIENSMTLTSPIEIQGLADNLYASASPSSVTVFLTGPLTTLQQLTPEDIRVVIDLFEIQEGTYQITPQIIIPPTDVEGSILPAMIEVAITTEPQPTPESTEP